MGKTSKTPQPDLERASHLDFTSLELGYESLRKLARNPNLTENEKMGFGEARRSGYERHGGAGGRAGRRRCSSHSTSATITHAPATARTIYAAPSPA